MRNRPIVITRTDAARLRELLATRARAARDQDHLEELTEELERARIADPNEVPEDVITIHTRIQVLDLVSGERRELTLVLPRESDAGAGRISVLAPLGTALLGYRAGDEVERRHITRVLTAAHGNKTLAARILGVDRKTLHRKLSQYARTTPGQPENGVSSMPG